ncbi:hypothetical protein [Flavobacterium undicola]|uniref:hypothetical protein n=1 Tax=Flavobacterium undicola TaxID=1932779 RepID=UPI0013773A61|nr:hypothetical protein [Flavobacterium undicola]MBA0883294.1 hypothetical protein [Flavobacterium undicola]
MIHLISLFLLLFSPLLFQLISGIKAIKYSISLSFWEVSLISLLGHVAFAIINLEIMSESLRHATHRNGLAWVFLLIMECIVGAILLIVILIQRYIQYRKNKSNEGGNPN